MALGRKTGGRQKGTPNRSVAELERKLRLLGCDPIEGMALIAVNPENNIELRAKMFSELAGYLVPKRKALEHSNDPDNPITQHGLTPEAESFIAETVALLRAPQ
jgi:hypothetical protein